MLADFEQRAASLAVSRYGADRAQVDLAAQAIAQEHAAGGTRNLVERLVSDRLLTPEQAQALLVELNDGRVAIGFSDPTPLPPANDDQVETRLPDLFYSQFPALVLQDGYRITSMESPDNNLEAVFRYLVAG